MKKLLTRNFFLLCNFIILIIKISLSIYNHYGAEYFEDWAIAENLATNNIYSLNLRHGSSAYKLPVYPFFLSFYMKIFGVTQATKFIILTQHIFYFIIPILLVKFFENFNLRNTGLLSSYFFLFSPAYFYYSNIIEATNIFVLLFVIWVYVYSLFWIKPVTVKRILMFSVLTALVALTQVVVVPIMLILLLILFLYKKISIKNLLTVFFITTVFYSPWVIRNYYTFDKIIISKSPVWQNIYLGYIPDHQVLNNKFMSEIEKQTVFDETKQHNEFEDEKIFRSEVGKIVQHDQLAPYKKGINNLISLWFVPKRHFDNNGLSILLGRKLYVILINFLLFLSLINIYKKNKKLFLLLCFLFVGFTLPYIIGHAANIRFKLDFEWIQTSVIALFISNILFKDKKQSI